MRRWLHAPITWVAIIFATIIGLVVWSDHHSCAKIMRYADTRRDSLVATIACEKGGDAAVAAYPIIVPAGGR